MQHHQRHKPSSASACQDSDPYAVQEDVQFQRQRRTLQPLVPSALIDGSSTLRHRRVVRHRVQNRFTWFSAFPALVSTRSVPGQAQA